MPKKGINNNKLRSKVSKLISKYERKTKKEQKFLEANQKTQKSLEELLCKIPEESNEVSSELNNELHQIHKNFKATMKSIKMEAKRERKEWKRQRKNERKERSKTSKGKGKGKGKGKRNKEEKENKKLLLENARIEELPNEESKEIESYRLIIDGWNIVGCDKIARKAMRGRRKEGAKRMISLVSKFGLISGNDKKYKIEIHFDGNGKSETQIFASEDETNTISIDVKFSGKSEIVDDRLVRELSECKESENSKVIVVTSDRELTLRLNKIGVKVMKSGCFYRKYLKLFAFEGLESSESDKNEKKEKKEKKVKKSKHKNGNGKRKGKKHWKKYIKNRFTDSSGSSSSSPSSSGFHSDSIVDVTPEECEN